MKVGDLVRTKKHPMRWALFEEHDGYKQYVGIIMSWNENARVARVMLEVRGSGILIHEEDLEVVSASR
jgi:hypothetical protein